MIDLSYKPHLVGGKVILRPFLESDFPYIEECLKDPEVLKLTGSDPSYDREAVLHWYTTRNDQTDRLDLAIIDTNQEGVVGEVVANSYEAETESMNFRILIGPRGRDRGLGTEATQLFVNHLFTASPLREITLSVFDFNPRARHVYEKAGFSEYGIEKDELEFEGERIDSILMSITRDVWQERRNGMRPTS
ncbi:GNAT family N-acetyltransferase [Sporosarcina aquimarina]|uniref:GNAT family protein n=1 Tax=Sporosarcina aquimarina TaxID=114975 RepID=A0ABU4G2H0_9BACL|nr:GNAT family protein [Sporosarcina aquimarina]MDW0111164.1 GNAT family protein [Sporosarcina aquimarina]